MRGGMMIIAMGSDHAGFEMKEYLRKELAARGLDVVDCGTYSLESVDYPDYAAKVCEIVNTGGARFGILVCATGVGIAMSANKRRGIRCALCTNEFTALMSRQHNDANVLAIGGMVIGKLLALAIAETFLRDDFSGGERHVRRIAKMMALEGDVS